VVTKSSILWDIKSFSPLRVNGSFGGKCHFHLQGRRISQARNQYESRWQAILAQLILRPEDAGDMFLRNVGYISESRTFLNMD
jgi:hypothetical protein